MTDDAPNNSNGVIPNDLALNTTNIDVKNDEEDVQIASQAPLPDGDFDDEETSKNDDADTVPADSGQEAGQLGAQQENNNLNEEDEENEQAKPNPPEPKEEKDPIIEEAKQIILLLSAEVRKTEFEHIKATTARFSTDPNQDDVILQQRDRIRNISTRIRNYYDEEFQENASELHQVHNSLQKLGSSIQGYIAADEKIGENNFYNEESLYTQNDEEIEKKIEEEYEKLENNARILDFSKMVFIKSHKQELVMLEKQLVESNFKKAAPYHTRKMTSTQKIIEEKNKEKLHKMSRTPK